MRVADWMSPDPTTMSPTASAKDAAALLRYYHVRHLPVVEADGQLVGMVSDRDLVTGVIGDRSRHGARSSDDLTVRDVMSQPVLTADPDEELRRAIHRMLSAHVNALAVVDDDQRLHGLLTTTDGLLALLEAVPADSDAR